ncbi:hypothetical protein GQR36_21555 [Enterococcus termitis]
MFSSPKLAQVGLTDQRTIDTNKFDVQVLDLSQWFTYKRVNEPLVKAKMVIEKATGLLAGASVLGNEADQLVNLFTVMINQKIPAEKINQLIMLYPTVGSDLSYLY